MSIVKYIAALIIVVTVILHIFVLVVETTPDRAEWSPYSATPVGLSKLASLSDKVYVNEWSVKLQRNITLILALVKPSEIPVKTLAKLVANSGTAILCTTLQGLDLTSKLLQELGITLRYTNLTVKDPVLNGGDEYVPLITVNITGILNRTMLLMIAIPNITYITVSGDMCTGIGYTSPTAMLENGSPLPLKPLIYVCTYDKNAHLYIVPSCIVFQNRYLTRNVIYLLGNITEGKPIITIIFDKELSSSILTMLKYYLTREGDVIKNISLIVLTPLCLASFVYLIADYAASRRASR